MDSIYGPCKKEVQPNTNMEDFSTGLNDVLQDHHYPLANPEKCFNKLNGGKFFSKIDLPDAYLQLEVDEESSKYLCINTHKGLYKNNRMPFGVKVAPAIFRQVIGTPFWMIYWWPVKIRQSTGTL